MLKTNLLNGGGKFALSLSVLTSIGKGAMLAQTEPFIRATFGMAQYVPVTQKLCYALAAIVAVVSAVIIYKKIQSGSENAKKLVATAVLSCVFLTASAQALPAVFGLDTETQLGMSEGFLADMGASTDWDGVPEEFRPRGATGFGPAPDGSFKKYMIAEDGTKVFIGAPSQDEFQRGAVGLAPDGTYRNYLTGANGKREWSKYPLTVNKNTPGAKLMKQPDGSYKWQVEAGGKAVAGEEVSWFYGPVAIDPATGEYRRYAIAEDGTKVFSKYMRVDYKDPESFIGRGIGANGKPREGEYWCVKAEDDAVIAIDWLGYGHAVVAGKVDIVKPEWSTVYMASVKDEYIQSGVTYAHKLQWNLSNPYEVDNYPTKQIAKHTDGQYHWYVTATDGTRLWGNAVKQ